MLGIFRQAKESQRVAAIALEEFRFPMTQWGLLVH
jgi:hypothetical protein